MPTQHTDLTESERATLTNALFVAAERFEEHVRDLTNAPDQKPAYASLAAQFGKQATEAREMADRLNNAEFIRLGKPVEDAEEDLEAKAKEEGQRWADEHENNSPRCVW